MVDIRTIGDGSRNVLPRSPLKDKNSNNSLDKALTSGSRKNSLSKYQESDDDSVYAKDFDFDNDDLNLSYSKFSHLSGVSFATSRDSGSMDMINESPFIKKIQAKLDIEFEHNSRTKVRENILHKNKVSKSETVNDENESPFIENTELPVKRNSVQSETGIMPLNNLKVRHPKFKLEESPNRRRLDISSTPEKYSKARQPSVKVSLTPAQRFKKTPGIGLSNALENFRFLNLVGRGAYANVYRAINLKTNQIIAIKQILLDGTHNVLELMGEIDLLKILKHPNIVKYHGFVTTSTSLNVFLEYCTGGSLRQLYKKLGHGLPESEIITYVKLILQGLQYLHEQGVVHRDVKSANVLITETNDIKLADFGVAAKVTSQYESVVGTPNWMAPEAVFGGEGICTASDIWSLGSTIIELFTTNPPYHDLNPMATLHAIGTDDHPPLPKNISSLAKNFLLECFQKQPSLRISAKNLLKHKWLSDNSRTSIGALLLHSSSMVSDTIQSRARDEQIKNRQLTLQKFDETEIKMNDSDMSNRSIALTKSNQSKRELLDKFMEKNEENDFDISTNQANFQRNLNIVGGVTNDKIDEEDDPFLAIDIVNFDTVEIEVQAKIEYLFTKLSSRIDVARSNDDEIIASLIKITGQMLHLVMKYNILHDAFIRDHGVLSLLELLENVTEMSNCQKLWLHTLSILNCIFENNILQCENFCLLGGIPIISQFGSTSFDLAVRLQVVRFINTARKSDKVLSMFVSCGGVRLLTKFVEEDFDRAPEFALTSIDCIHEILSKDLARSKSDLCRILSKHGLIFWYVVLLNRLTKLSPIDINRITHERVNATIKKIIDILKYFGQSEAKVRINIANTDLFKMLIRIYPNVVPSYQLDILKFFKAMSCISEVLKILYSADILEFLVNQLKQTQKSDSNYKDILNNLCPCLYNCCYLNHTKEIEIVKLGVVPILKSLSKTNMPFRQFVLPVLCELVYCDDKVRVILRKYDILSVYFNLLVDPYWQSNALDSIMLWLKFNPDHVKLDDARSINCLIGGFMLPQVSNLESTLDNYLKLLKTNNRLCSLMMRESLIKAILSKLNANKAPVVQLSLLRILKCFLTTAKKKRNLREMEITKDITDTLSNLKSKKHSILVEEIALDLIALL